MAPIRVEPLDGNGPIEPGEERLRDLPAYLNGRSKTYLGIITFLWTALIGVAAFAWGEHSANDAIERHAGIDGHPVIIERVDAVQYMIDLRLQTITSQLNGISTRLDSHMTRTEERD